jgi:hypothetical protein
MATVAAAVDLGLERRFLLTAIRTPRGQPQVSRWASVKLMYRAAERP